MTTRVADDASSIGSIIFTRTAPHRHNASHCELSRANFTVLLYTTIDDDDDNDEQSEDRRIAGRSISFNSLNESRVTITRRQLTHRRYLSSRRQRETSVFVNSFDDDDKVLAFQGTHPRFTIVFVN